MHVSKDIVHKKSIRWDDVGHSGGHISWLSSVKVVRIGPSRSKITSFWLTRSLIKIDFGALQYIYICCCQPTLHMNESTEFTIEKKLYMHFIA